MSFPFFKSTKKYSARGFAIGSVFCPACRKLTNREVVVCPACGFHGQHTMSIFPVQAPPLDLISDHACLFSDPDKLLIRRGIERMQRRFPQIRWRVVTADLHGKEDAGLFSFWLLNVSPPSKGEEPNARAWTILLVVLAHGEIAVVPGYSAEVWFSGHDWSWLLGIFQRRSRKRGYGIAVRDFLIGAEDRLERSWFRMKKRMKGHMKRSRKLDKTI